jgi:hypothetical protein
MNKSNMFSPEVRERAVRLVQEHRGEYPSLWAAIESIAPKIGCVPQTLNELDRRLKSCWTSLTNTGTPTGSSRSARHCRSPHRDAGGMQHCDVSRSGDALGRYATRR